MKEKIILSPAIINDIAQNLEMSMNCWYHIPTQKVIWVPDELQNAHFEEELWSDVFEEIEGKEHECIAFRCMESHEKFSIMDSFAENEVADKKLRAMLISALANKKPFRHFKAIIDNSSYREDWFAYQLKRFEEYVQQQLDWYNNRIDFEEMEDE